MKIASLNGIGADYAMRLAQRLYTKGFITYPRTETTRYSPHYNFKEVLYELNKEGENKYK